MDNKPLETKEETDDSASADEASVATEPSIDQAKIASTDVIQETTRLEEETEGTPSSKTFGPTLTRLGVLGGLLMLSLFVFSSGAFNIAPQETIATPTEFEEVPQSPFEHISLEAQAIYVYDLENKKILYSKNEHAQLPLASLTKLMTALVASELISETTIITIKESSILVDGDNGFRIGERWKFKDLLDYTLLVSSNDGAHAIAEVAGAFTPHQEENGTKTKEGDAHVNFINQMNQKAVSLGLTQSYFINESGLDANPSVGGGYGSAQDIATLLAHIMLDRPLLLEATTYKTRNFVSEDEFIYNATNTNIGIGTIPGLIASKTGFTDLAGGNLAIAFDVGINHPIIAVVLGSSFEGRFKDMEQLVLATFTKIAQ